MERAPFIDTGKHPGKDGLEYKNGTEHRICVSSYWRKVRLMFDASSRFRHILHMAEDELSKDSSHLSNTGKCKLVDDSLELQLRKFSTVAHVLRATLRFKEAGQKCQNGPVPPGFGIGPHQLQNIMLERQLQTVVRHGGVSKIAKLLNSNLDSGLDDFDDALEERRTAFGSNKVPSKPGKSFWMFVWDACHDTTLIILMVCAVVSLAAEMWSDGPKEGWYDGVSIAAAVAIVIVVTATSDYRQSLQFKSLSEEKKNIQVEVIRRGRRCKISVFDILVGDIVPINIGDQVPADGILVSGQSLTIDESCMTGESLPVHKDMKEPFLLSGCKVVDGYGSMLVLAVGLNTEWGKILSTLSEDNGEETPLQVRLSGAAKLIGQVGLTVAVVVFVILFVRFFAVDFKKNSSASNAINKLVNAFAIAVTIVVVAVPEGLPLAVTLTLAYSMRKMMTDKSMVRKLAACETMGSATTICSDKTGTLTLNQMVVTKSWVAGKLREAEEVQIISKPVYKTILAGLCQNSTGSVYVPTDGGESEVAGTPTETAALAWGLQIGMNYDEMKRSTSAVHIEAFNSAKKRAGVIIRRIDGNVEAHWKGAAEMILEMSANWVDENGVVHSMTPEMATELKNNIEGMAAKSLRCIAFAYKPLSRADVPDTEEKRKTWKIPDDDLTFLCVIGIKDPCRPGVSDAVTKCKAAQIKVRMVTGDSLLTAQAIAQECGILTKDGVVVEGRVFREYSQEDMDRVLPRLDVLARSSPTDKLLLVKELKKRGDVVAVTGDGTNDAPALHDADVGLSMGISGTEVAKESSDIVILDDNFASIVKVVRWGRSVYANIQKFIQFQLTVNVTALVINFVAAVSSGKVPLTAVQLLWVNLIMDTLGALALATEPPTDDLMDKAPVGRTQPLITNIMWRNIFTQSLYQIAVLMTIDYAGKSIFGLQGEADSEIRKNTIVFNAFVMCQVFNEVNARRPDKKNVFEGLFKNRLFVAIILVEVVFQFLIVQFLGKFATTKPLTWQQWLVCVAIGSVAWPLALCSKFFPVREKPYVNTHGLKVTLRRNWRRKGPALLRSNVNSSSSSHANVAGDVVHGNELPQIP